MNASGMEEEEEDRLLLSSLGVTSANPEEIERDILIEVNNDVANRDEAGKSIEGQFLIEEQGAEESFTSQAKLHSKLRAVEVEIDAVKASFEQAKSVARNEHDVSVDIENEQEGDTTDTKNAARVSANGLALRQALAADRLRSLKKTRDQLQKELEKDFPLEDSGNDKLLGNLVKEESKHKSRFKKAQISGKDSKKRQKTVAFHEDVDFDAVLDAASVGFVETERDELIRKGILTPFHKLKGFERRLQQPGPSNSHSAPEEDTPSNVASASIANAARKFSTATQARPTTKLLNAESLPKLEPPTQDFRRLKKGMNLMRTHNAEKLGKNQGEKLGRRKRPMPDKSWRKVTSSEEKMSEGIEEDVPKSKKEPSPGINNSVDSDYEVENQEEVNVEADDEPTTVTLEGGLKIPETIFNKLFDYQKVGVQWLWELHCQRAGGIIGDEMGLGKTIQVISFLAALHFSKMYRPSIVICPVTLLRQWRREIQKWYPKFHVEILHDSARGPTHKRKQVKDGENDKEIEDLSDSNNRNSPDSDNGNSLLVKTTKRWDFLINRVLSSESGLLITSYEQLRLLREKLLDVEWGYAVLDEGHRIRNPNAEVTLVCKQLQTVHRIIMTGAPIQNKLTELWSLFDFAFPGKLGVLPIFEAQFALPISIGGYANATPLQVSTAYRCAVVLRDLIMPYLLRRVKADVNAQLPKKTEHVLFCRLTPEQRSVYRAFLASSEVEQIFNGNKNSLYGIDVLRKICNHPDILEREHSSGHPDYGNVERSGKMKVVAQVLKVWKDQGHRVLVFSQTQQMLDILENFLIVEGYTYRRMDGLTPVRQRMTLMDEFNNSTHIFIFILTAKVGGLGTNLTGANRVIIFDPDWNPSTDIQARERAWRIGQTRDVTVYRLITRGTIEEKIYHRQIYKHFLTNKILKNPQQRRFFKARDMRDLFTLQDDGDGGSTETSNIFSQLAGEVNLGVLDEKQDKQEPTTVTCDSNSSVSKGTKLSKGETSLSKGKEKSDQSDGEPDEEANILRSLFEAHGLHSAMNHDVIMNANDEEKLRLEEEASQVAQRAAEALRQSRMLRSRESISIPTWTGRAGMAGAPSSVRKKFGSTVNSQLVNAPKPSEGTPSSRTNKPHFAAGASIGKALSSSELLARIRKTQESAIGAGLEHELGSVSGSHNEVQPTAVARPSSASRMPSVVQPEVLIRQLCTFIQKQGGSISSASIVDHFKDKVPSKDLPLFKNLLKEIATLEKEPGGSKWVLKSEYQQ